MKRELGWLLLLLTLVALSARILESQRAEKNLTICRSNLKNLATALEMYSSDNSGRYPISLRELHGTYLYEMPKCPVTGSDYGNSYEVTSQPDGFSYGCRGRHHGEPTPEDLWLQPGGLVLGYPWYTSSTGFPDLP
jgi:hypothetical protein